MSENNKKKNKLILQNNKFYRKILAKYYIKLLF